jgi:hypothetical protein
MENIIFFPSESWRIKRDRYISVKLRGFQEIKLNIFLAWTTSNGIEPHCLLLMPELNENSGMHISFKSKGRGWMPVKFQDETLEFEIRFEDNSRQQNRYYPRRG